MSEPNIAIVTEKTSETLGTTLLAATMVMIKMPGAFAARISGSTDAAVRVGPFEP
jgi:hypothetical protein